MAAMPQRRVEEESSTEVIYLLLPPGSAAAAGTTTVKPPIRPWSLVESAALLYWNVRHHDLRATPLGQSARAVGLLGGYAMIGVPLLVAGYFLKWAIGFDIVPGTHMGGYIPFIGGGHP